MDTLSSTSTPPQVVEPTGLFASRRGRVIKEHLIAYLFLLPASLIILTFGIFPVGFALYVSLHKWRLVKGGFSGLNNYVKAIDTLAYVIAFWLGIAAMAGAVIAVRRLVRMARERDETPWLWLIPAVVLTAAIGLFIRFTVVWLPELLNIPEKMRSLERTDAVIRQLLFDTFQVPAVIEALQTALLTFAVAIILLIVFFSRYRKVRNPGDYLGYMVLVLGLLLAGFFILGFTYNEIQIEYIEAVEDDTELSLWAQVVTISAGFVLLGLAWLVWKRVGEQPSNTRTILIMLAAAIMIAGGWFLIGELPRIIAEGDDDFFQGFLVTIFYSAGTVPFQLIISLFLAYILFQNIKGQSFFRMVYFLPYVTPAVASAAVFRILFTNRPDGIINRLIRFAGMEPQKWIQEPTGVFQMLAEGAGLSLPEWAAGPSLALVVIIIYNIWTFVGYDTVIFLAGLGSIPHELYEAAEVDGAGRWALFRHITLPLLSPTTFFLSLIAIIGTFKAFTHIWVLRDTGALGTTDTASVVIFLEFFQNSRLGYASAMAFVLFGVILTLTLIQNRIASRRVFYG